MGQQSFTQFGENFKQQFEQQIETAVESAVMQSMGSILVALGSELMGQVATCKPLKSAWKIWAHK
jgi:hypothetical protein